MEEKEDYTMNRNNSHDTYFLVIETNFSDDILVYLQTEKSTIELAHSYPGFHYNIYKKSDIRELQFFNAELCLKIFRFSRAGQEAVEFSHGDTTKILPYDEAPSEFQVAKIFLSRQTKSYQIMSLNTAVDFVAVEHKEQALNNLKHKIMETLK